MSYGMCRWPEGDWLMSFDAAWLPEPGEAGSGEGFAIWTDDPAQAMRFATWSDGMECWTTTSTSWPVRMDGKPNRPLTRYTIEIKEIPNDQAQTEA